ncbi:MAG: metallophosphoesterase [Bacteroidales bacterium]|nr:metallophosphoesterase [Bacteroidales bacterium]
MKRILQWVLFILVSAGIILILKQTFPKNSGALNYFLIFLILDAYLWQTTKKSISGASARVKLLLTLLYWIPLTLVIIGVIAGFFKTFAYWSVFSKSFLTSFVLMAYLSKLFPITFLLLSDLFLGSRILVRFVQKKQVQPVKQTSLLFRIGWIAGLICFGTLLSGMLFWEHHIKIRKQVVVLPELPPSFSELKIVQISDLHLGTWMNKKHLRNAIDSIESLHPDLIFVTGDMVNYASAEAVPFLPDLKKLSSRYGIYVILGNHDYGDYMKWENAQKKKENMDLLYSIYHSLGWKLLRNEHDLLRIGTDSIAILGVENWGATSRFQRLANLPVASRGIEDMPLKLLLSHDPSFWDSIVSKQYPDIDLTFSGHTHGGQIGMESRLCRWSFAQILARKWAGLYMETHPDHRKQYLYINRGLGTIAYAGRIGIWSEITLVTLKRDSTETSQ